MRFLYTDYTLDTWQTC